MKIALIIYGITVLLGVLGVTIHSLRMKLVIHTYNYKNDRTVTIGTKIRGKLLLVLICLVPIYNALQPLVILLPEESICNTLEKNGWYRED